MWTTIISVATKVLPWITSLFSSSSSSSDSSESSSSSKLPWILVGILAVLLLVSGGFIWWKNCTIEDLEEDVTYYKDKSEAVQLQLTEVQNTNEILVADIAILNTEKLSINGNLAACYESIDTLTHDYSIIEKNMREGAKVKEPLNLDEKGEPIYERVTKQQNTSGVNFINNIFDSIE